MCAQMFRFLRSPYATLSLSFLCVLGVSVVQFFAFIFFWQLLTGNFHCSANLSCGRRNDMSAKAAASPRVPAAHMANGRRFPYFPPLVSATNFNDLSHMRSGALMPIKLNTRLNVTCAAR
jgi:hypothetical protein